MTPIFCNDLNVKQAARYVLEDAVITRVQVKLLVFVQIESLLLMRLENEPPPHPHQSFNYFERFPPDPQRQCLLLRLLTHLLFIHSCSFILNIYIAPLQENYSEAIPTPARLKRAVLS